MSSAYQPPSKQNMEDDDEDLELLRIAALKTLKPSNNKIEVVEMPIYATQSQQPNPPQPLPTNNNMYVRHSLPPTAHHMHMHPNYVTGMPPIQHRIVDPYIPMGINPHWDENIPKYYAQRGPPRQAPINMPPGPSLVKPAVQLSPRSAAFVMQNNCILEQRKKSPRMNSLSPDYRPCSPGRNYARSPPQSPSYRPSRWSVSPPPFKNKYVPRRSLSRSPSPPARNRSLSRSPPPVRSRYNSRSPPQQKRINRKSRSRSPLRYPTRRSRSPSPAYNKAVKPVVRSYSPPRKSPPLPRNRPYHSYNGKWDGKSRRTPSPGRQVNQRASSPLSKKRSRSPSNRGSGSNARNNSNSRYNKNGRYQSSNPSSRAASPAKKRVKSKSKSRSKTPVHTKKAEEEKVQTKKAEVKDKVAEPAVVEEEIKQDNKVKDILQLLNEDNEIKLLEEEKYDDLGIAETKESTSSKEEIEESSTPPIPRMKTEEEIEDELLASDNDNTEDELDMRVEIDLFASDESESENEGRFKSSNKHTQSKSEKPTTLSYTKLGQSSTSNVKDALHTSSGRSSPRDRERRRDGKRSDSRNERRRDYTSTSSSSRNKISLNSKVDVKSEAAKKDDAKNMFKSTFKAVEGDSKKAIEPPRVEYPKQKSEISEKKSVVSLKRTPITTLTKGDPVLKSTITFDNTPSVSPSTQSQQATNVKKAVHMRLGPSLKSGYRKVEGASSSASSTTTTTTTSWKNKKSWRQEKV